MSGLRKREQSALDWLALIISHIPRHGEQMVRYYGYYSNAARGKRRKLGMIDAEVQEIARQEADTPYRKKCRANWACWAASEGCQFALRGGD